MEVLKEAFYTYFTIDNFFERDNYLQRKMEFVNKYNIDSDLVKEYAEAYGCLILKLPLEKVKKMTRTINFITVNDIKININRLARIIFAIEKSDDFSYIKSLVLEYHISTYTVDRFFEYFSFYKIEHNKDLIST